MLTSRAILSIHSSIVFEKDILFLKITQKNENSNFLFTRASCGMTLYQVYRYVPPQRVWFLSRLGLKSGIDFEHFGLKLGMIIGGTFTKAPKLIFLPKNRGE